MTKKMDNANKEPNPQDSLVDALESIKSLLAKSDQKLNAARESIAIASNQTPGPLSHDQSGQYEIPVLDDIVIPLDAQSATEEVSNISEQISEKIEETLAAVAKPSTKPDPQVMLDYLGELQKTLEKSMRDSLMKSIVTIEVGLKKTLNTEINKIRKQIKKDFK
jgi:hypothetical protein